MKNVFSLLATLLCSISMMFGTVLPQHQEEHRPEQATVYSTRNTHPNGVMLVDGHVMMIRNMTITKLKRRVILRNGTRVSPNGMCTDRRGNKRMLRENEHLDMNGRQVMMQQKR